VRRRLAPHEPLVIKPASAGAARDLLELARRQEARLVPVELAQLREQHGPDRDVHAHAERVRAADGFQQALPRELLH